MGACVLSCSVVSSLSATPYAVACQAPPVYGISEQEYWSEYKNTFSRYNIEFCSPINYSNI